MLWISLILFLLFAFFLLRKGSNRKGIFLLLLGGTILVSGWGILKPSQANTTEYAQFQAKLGQDQAVLLELQSPF